MKNFFIIVLIIFTFENGFSRTFTEILQEVDYVTQMNPVSRKQYLESGNYNYVDWTFVEDTDAWVITTSYFDGSGSFTFQGNNYYHGSLSTMCFLFKRYHKDNDLDYFSNENEYIYIKEIQHSFYHCNPYVPNCTRRWYLSYLFEQNQTINETNLEGDGGSIIYESEYIYNGFKWISLHRLYPDEITGSFSLQMLSINTLFDCYENSYNLPLIRKEWLDSDNDGYGNQLTSSRVRPSSCDFTQGWVNNYNDCNDSDSTIINPVAWYRDSDDDGYGNINDQVFSCHQPFGYVRNNDDCDDANFIFNVIERTYYADIDNDGFGDVNDFIISSCPPQTGNYITNCYFDDCPTVAGTQNGCPLVAYDFDNDNKNYNYTRTYLEAYEPNELSTVTDDKVIEQIAYTDGFGNVTQTNNIKFSPQGKDIIQHIEYDGNGNITKNYLPYVSANDDGLFDDNSLTNTQNYYNTPEFDNTTNPYVEKIKDNSPFNKTLEIALPGEDWKATNGHTLKTEKQPQLLNDNVRKYKINFTSLNGIAQPHLSFDCDNEYYADNELIKTIVKNQNWSNTQTNLKDNTKEIFKDKYGRTVLERKFNSEANTINHDTYYIYDEVGNLYYVLPPKAIDILEGGTGAKPANSFQVTLPWTKIANVSKELATEKNKTLKEVKDTSVKEQVLNEKYNAQGAIDISVNTDNEVNVEINLDPNEPMPLINGLLATLKTDKPLKDESLGEISGDGFSYTLYIQKNAIYIEGEGKVLIVNETLQSYRPPPVCDVDLTILNNLSYQYKYDYKNRLIEKKLPGKGWEYILYNKKGQVALTQNAIQRTNNQWNFVKYDALGRVAYTGISKTMYNRNDIQELLLNTGNQFETKTSTLTTIGINENITTISYTNDNSYSEINDVEVLTAFYYDDYSYGGRVITLPNDINGNQVSYYTKNLPTISKIKVLGRNEWITKVNYYDDKGRTIVTSNNSNFANSEVKLDLDFTGKILKTVKKHNKKILPRFGGGVTTTYITDEFKYDRVGRLLKLEQSINDQQAEVIFENQYSELGRLISKGVGNKVGQNRLQTIDIKYNVFGLLKGINDVANLGNDLFAYEINYTNPTDASTTKMYNGNISEVRWKSASNTSAIKSYSNSYDALNRINKAEFDNSADSLQDFGLNSITYDKNGNIYSLERTGSLSQTTYDIIDDLSYVYDSNSNKLLGVSDNAGEKGFKNGTNRTNDYVYDIDGRLLVDRNKGITNIEYNYLNQPKKITFFNNDSTHREAGTITYMYDALGNKLGKIINRPYQSDGLNATYYSGNMIYTKSTGLSPVILKYIKHPEGYIKVNGTDYKYVYQFKDHLGNIRLSYSDTDNDGIIAVNEIREEHGYYPFGLKHDDYSVVTGVAHPNKFNGKELEQALGLNLYEMDFRLYDQTLGRFMVIDPLAEYFGQVVKSPYSFASNNPISFNDPSGLCDDCPDPDNYSEQEEYRVNGETYVIQGGEWVRDGGNLDEVVIDRLSQKGVMNEEMDSGLESANEQDGDRDEDDPYYEDPFFYINSGLSATGLGITIKGQTHISNELWHINKTPKNASLKSRIRFRNDARWKNPVSRAWRKTNIAKVANIRNVGTKLGIASIVINTVSVVNNEEIRASDVLNTFMVGISFTGFGAIFSGAYFLVDITLTVTTGRSIGDRLDGAVGKPLVQWHD